MSREKQSALKKWGCALGFLLTLPVWLPLFVLSISFWTAHRAILYPLVWLRTALTGKDVLFVSSDSSIWHDYMRDEILPLVRERAVVLNWSERNKWQSLSLTVQAFHCYGAGRDFNPMVVIIRPFRRAKLFRFLPAFKDWKHGKDRGVDYSAERVGTELVEVRTRH